MNRIDRLNAILIQLQGKPKVPLEALVDRFEVSNRTIFRDIRSLIEAGVPIGGDAGQGYFIVEGYHLPPVVFNKEEATALLIGEKLIEQNADNDTVKQFKEAMHKVKAVLRYSDKDFLDALEKNISVLPSYKNIGSGFPHSHMFEIQNALANKKLLRLVYLSNYKEQTTKREVEPLGLVYYSERWHLIAYCRMRDDYRDFRCDRIEKCEILSEKIDQEKYHNYNKFLDRMLLGTDSNEAMISVPKKIARFISDQKYYYGFAEEKVNGEHVEMKFFTYSYAYFARWLMMFGKEVRILYPNELQKVAQEHATELHHHYTSNEVRVI